MSARDVVKALTPPPPSELIVIVPFPEAVHDDDFFDIWDAIRQEVITAITQENGGQDERP